MKNENDDFQNAIFQRARYEVKLEDNFYEFVKESWEYVDSNTFIPTYHIEVVCDHLQAVSEGHIKRLIINIPPGFAKSLLVSVLYPAWVWTKNPQHCFLTGSNSTPLATRDTVRSRDLIKSDWYQYLWGEVFSFSDDQNQKTYYTNDHKGHRVSFSTSSHVTGWRANTLILDDAMSFSDRYSEVKRNAINDLVGGGLLTRLNNQEEDSFIVMGQRLHYEDVTAFLMKKGNCELLNMPLEFMDLTKCKTSIFVDRRKEGEILWKERWNTKMVKNIKKDLGSIEYSSQYQQSPTEVTGGIININWFKYYNPKSLPNFDMIVDSWDTAFSEKQESDYTVGGTFGITSNMFYLLNIYRAQVGMPELKRAMVDINNRFKSNKIIVEDKGSGTSAVQELTFRTTLPFVTVKPEKCKVTRAHAAAPTVEAGKIALPENTDWVFDFKEEVRMFPAGAHDDQVDMLTQFINHQTKDLPIIPLVLVG